jgi:hypothetical protein
MCHSYAFSLGHHSTASSKDDLGKNLLHRLEERGLVFMAFELRKISYWNLMFSEASDKDVSGGGPALLLAPGFTQPG